MNLQGFLNPIQPANEKIVISERFLDDKGIPLEWEIKPITQEENDVIMRHYTKTTKKGEQKFDRVGYMNELIATAVVFPDLHNAQLQSHYGVLGHIDLLKKMLLIGEFAKLSEFVQKTSGLDETFEELVEEAKN